MFDVVSFSAAREKLATLFDRVEADAAPLMITRQGKEPMVVMSMTQFRQFQETAYLLQSPANAQHLQQSLKEADNSKDWVQPNFLAQAAE